MSDPTESFLAVAAERMELVDAAEFERPAIVIGCPFPHAIRTPKIGVKPAAHADDVLAALAPA